jgi:hypothetical protein
LHSSWRSSFGEPAHEGVPHRQNPSPVANVFLNGSPPTPVAKGEPLQNNSFLLLLFKKEGLPFFLKPVL